ncbi:BrnT family toxin [beta proteobacterium MWH-UniP1]
MAATLAGWCISGDSNAVQRPSIGDGFAGQTTLPGGTLTLVFVYTKMYLVLVFDPEKDRENRIKHGFSLGDVVFMDWSEISEAPDTRFNYGERRMICYGMLESNLMCAVFVDRGLERRIISFRRANLREIKRYGKVH